MIVTVANELSTVNSKDYKKQILIEKIKEQKEIIQAEKILIEKETFFRSELDKNQIWANVENIHLEEPSEWPLRFYFNLRRV